jgi:hypothetical protein
MLSIQTYSDSACTETMPYFETILAVQDACQKSGLDSYANVKCDAVAQTVSYSKFLTSISSQYKLSEEPVCNEDVVEFEYKYPHPPKVYKINFNCERFTYPNTKYFVSSSVYYKYTCEDAQLPDVASTNNSSKSSAFALKSGKQHVQVRSHCGVNSCIQCAY